MEPRKLMALGVGVGLILMVWWSMRPAPGSPEDICETAVKELVAAAESKDLKPFKKWLSENVRDGQGRDKDQMLRVMQGIFFRYRDVKLTILSLNAQQDTNPNLVNVNLSLLMSDTALPQDQGSFILKFRNEGGQWRIESAEWQDAAGYGI